jgi:MFS family permease
VTDGGPAREDDRGAAMRSAVTGSLTIGRLLAAMGGWLGIAEGVLPALVFLVVFQLTTALVAAVVASLALSALFLAWRLLRRQNVTAAIGGALGAGLSAVLALVSSDSRNFFVVGLLTNAAYGAVLLVSVLVRWPLIGVAAAFLLGDQATWRSDPVKRRLGTWLTLLWIGLFAVRLIVELPFYFAGRTEELGIARLLLGVPLYAPVLVLTVLAVQAVYRGRPERGGIVNEDGRR